MSRTILEIPTENLRKLPEGANYNSHNGQARVLASLKGDTILITATCDSLQRLIWYYERELVDVYRDMSYQTKETKPGVSSLKAFLYGVATGIIILLIIFLLIKLKTNGKVWSRS